MCEILFRGKRKERDFYGLGGEWIYGIPIQTHIGTFICFEENPHYCNQYGYMEIEEISKVFPETVGQYTGLTDKNGNKIFEGDIVKHYNHSNDSNKFDIGYVFWDEEHSCFKRTCNDGRTEETSYYIWNNCLYEVIGNIHDNPKMLEAGNA